MTVQPTVLSAGRMTAVCGGSLSGDPDVVVTAGRADSRLCQPGFLFVAVKGEYVDGNRFVSSAWDNGAEVALVAKTAEVPEPPPGKALIRVDDTVGALQAIAADQRRAVPGLNVVGITGSNGKTTTKDILASIAMHEWGDRALVTRGNYNSDVGLPLMLLELNAGHEVAILEMGMNRKGEIAELADVALPGIGVITNIGTAHIGLLGSREAIADEKRQIFRNARKETVAVIGDREDWADFLLQSFPGSVRRFGDPLESGWDTCTDRGLDGYILSKNGMETRLQLPGRHNLANAMAAVEAARALGASETSIAAGLGDVRAAGGRSEVRRGAITVLRDGYNANPESLEAAFELIKQYPTGSRRVLVLGEMLELGKESESAIRKAGGAAAELKPDAVFLFGESLELFEGSARDAGFSGYLRVFADMDKLKMALEAYLEPGDLVLVKGSRGSALERLDETLEKVGTG